MNYIIKKGSTRTMYLFVITGVFLILTFSYNLYSYLQTNQFIIEFPGDWDKPLGIAIGVYLIIRSRKFVNQARKLFIKVSQGQLVYRTKASDSVNTIHISDIDKVQGKEDKVVLITKGSTKLEIDLSAIKSDKDKKTIRKTLIDLV
ncbi:hypothetical protein [Aquimarina sediminis]|uniref:hypothetical protein n=1 Tax=Aquimarina sediminis TaxID=2070536 RepID=UPI000CA0503F|nr:hypothetical protein [Aquimarina sediminis]